MWPVGLKGVGMTKQTEEEKRDEELEKKFGSVLQLSVKVLRPMDKYPFERAVWDSEIRVPITEESEKIDAIVNAWVKTMEAGLELASAFARVEAVTPK